jgi:hypothetical protein
MKKTKYPWVLTRHPTPDTTTLALWCHPVGPIVFRSRRIADEYAARLAEQSGIEGPWTAVRFDLAAAIKIWGDDKYYWRYSAPGSYLLIARQPPPPMSPGRG